MQAKMFSKILVANRGEIALRIMKTARTEGLQTVAVYSDADAGSLHVAFADEAVRLGPAPVSESYLRADLIIAAAHASGAEAIHPGYGFLSENANFARAVEEAGLIFIGPRAETIDLMGDKARAKRAMIAADVPCVPGYEGEDQSDQRLIEEGRAVGVPLMVKAAAGGGGKGMRLVEDLDTLPQAIELARSEALNAFGSDELIIERAIQKAKHVEVQIMADDPAHGTVLHLGERDCSVQRRHQKVVEEAPVDLPKATLKGLRDAAVKAAKAVAYKGAGTIEFLVDAQGFYFLEMNTRLQVEHPVTEEMLGLDLVALQLEVARDRPLPLAQSNVVAKKHAVEVRLYAEDAAKDFMPSSGPVDLFATPSMEGLRVDTGVQTGGEVSSFYDPMIAKIIASGANRAEALRVLIKGLEQTAVFGLTTNRDFLLAVLKHPAFQQQDQVTNDFLSLNLAEGFEPPEPGATERALAAVLIARAQQQENARASLGVSEELLGWSSDGMIVAPIVVQDKQPVTCSVVFKGVDHYLVVEGQSQEGLEVQVLADDGLWLKVSVNGQTQSVIYASKDGTKVSLATETQTLTYHTGVASAQTAETSGTGLIGAPMHGKLLSLDVSDGDAVQEGQRLAVLEAMKMQHEILADVDGIVAQLTAKEGDQLAANDLILEISSHDES